MAELVDDLQNRAARTYTGAGTQSVETAVPTQQPIPNKPPTAAQQAQQDYVTYQNTSRTLESSAVIDTFRQELTSRGIYLPPEINAQTAALVTYLAKHQAGKDYAALISDPAFQAALQSNNPAEAEAMLARFTGRVETAISESGLSSDKDMKDKQASRFSLDNGKQTNVMTFALTILNKLQKNLINDINLIFKEIKDLSAIRDEISNYARYLASKSTDLSHETSKQKDEKAKNKVKVDVEIREFPELKSLSPSGQVYVNIKDKAKSLDSSGLKAQTEKTGALEKQISTKIDRLNQKVNNLYSQSEQNVSMINSLISNYFRGLAKISDNVK